ncbi:hypothetical protein Q8X10_04315 [Pseudomonas aeruginosa]|uniref:hypothetical protein n=1 Tax=Pseudomonas aeruginosa TaxID=287 RepID=UPI0029052E6D|nr:hypothetical protein [Pseudomonas aeruginosa]MDU0753919.1 hypothetical protein [Pseudomonas aeruginosa]
MDTNNNDKDLRALVSAADRILQAAEEDRNTAAKAMGQLRGIEAQARQSLGLIPDVLSKSVDRLADASSEKAAKLLGEKFREADAAASRATAHYARATENARPTLNRILIMQCVVSLLQLAMFIALMVIWLK